jgi:hypothetical protein
LVRRDRASAWQERQPRRQTPEDRQDHRDSAPPAADEDQEPQSRDRRRIGQHAEDFCPPPTAAEERRDERRNHEREQEQCESHAAGRVVGPLEPPTTRDGPQREQDGLVKQTFLLTYTDAFRIVGLFFLVCIPLLLLFKRRRGGGGPVEVAMH